MSMPTFEEYKAKVRAIFRERYWKKLSEDEVDAFFEKEEDTLKEWYNDDKKSIIKGKAPEDYILNAGASSAAYGLDLLY